MITRHWAGYIPEKVWGLAEGKSLWLHDTALQVRSDAVTPATGENWRRDYFRTDYAAYGAIRRTLEELGFTFHGDPRVDGSIRRSHHRGARGDLRFKSSYYPAGCEVTFYQDLVTVNSNGGEFDFDKRAKMPYLVRVAFELAMSRIAAALGAMGFKDRTVPTRETATPWQVFDYGRRTSGHYKPDLGRASYTNGNRDRTDRDGRLVDDGDVRWCRDYKGYLCQGRAFYDLNNMWRLLTGNPDTGYADIRYVACHELFTYDPKRHARKRYQRPEVVIERRLREAIAARAFERCIPLRDALVAIEAQAGGAR